MTAQAENHLTLIDAAAQRMSVRWNAELAGSPGKENESGKRAKRN